MRHPILKTVVICLAAATPAMAIAQVAPSFQDLEARYPRDAPLDKTQVAALLGQTGSLFGASVPRGTPITIAEARLQAAGATCRADRHATGVVTCLYHQYDLSDGAADDIRWTVALHVASDTVADVTVDRYVDRHGSN
jgi:hypothetical protein